MNRKSRVAAIAVVTAAAAAIFTLGAFAADTRFPPDSLLLWDGDTAGAASIVQLGQLNEDDALVGKCFEGRWPDRPEQTNPVIRLADGRKDIDLTGFDEIWFFVKASEEGKTFDVELRQWSGRVARAGIDDCIEGGKLTTDWKLVRIPLKDFVPNTEWQNQVDHIVFGAKGRDRSTLPRAIYVDEVYAVKRPPSKEATR